MSKVLFAPFGIVAGILSGLIGKRLFMHAWSVVAAEDPPDGSVHRTTWPKLIFATALEGAIYRATKAAVDHGTRRGFYRLTGSWPGQEES
jgi:Protein of unknown function (DUF4235)